MTATLNPLRLDPSRTRPLLRSLGAQLRRLFSQLHATATASLERFTLLPPDQAVVTFRRSLDTLLEQLFFADDWYMRYLSAAYAQAAGRAYDRVRRAPLRDPVRHAGGKEEFLQRLLGGVRQLSGLTGNAALQRDWRGRFISERARLLSLRLESELRGVTQAAAQELARALITGIEQGQTPRQIALAMRRATTIGYQRALRIAHNELVRASAEGTLDALAELGVERVGATVEYTTAGNPCPRCAALEGQTYTIDKARGMIPQHPWCACAWEAVQEVEPAVGVIRGR